MRLVFSFIISLLPVLAIGQTNDQKAAWADPEVHGQLSTLENTIIGENGDHVRLKGGALMDIISYNYREQMISYLKNTGANAIRVPIHWGRAGFAGNYGVFWQRFQQLVDFAIDQNFYVIADFHAVADPRAPGLESLAETFFTDVAETYGGTGHILYEVLNEPPGKSNYSSYVPWSAIKSYATSLIDLIRSIDEQAIVIVGTPNWSQFVDVAIADPIERPNLVYAFHFYATLHKFDDKLYDWSREVPIMVTEWAGQTPENSDGKIDFKSLIQYIEWMNEESVSWLAWSYSDESQPYGWFYPGSFADGRVQDRELRSWGRIVLDLLDDSLLNHSVSW
jgi:endoglucanase